MTIELLSGHRGPRTDEEAKKIIPQGVQWELVYDHCRKIKGMSILESMLAVWNAKEALSR